MTLRLLLLITFIALAACGASESPAAEPLPTTEPAVPIGPTTAGVVFGRTEEGAFFHGAPDAPVTFIDYSDFL